MAYDGARRVGADASVPWRMDVDSDAVVDDLPCALRMLQQWPLGSCGGGIASLVSKAAATRSDSATNSSCGLISSLDEVSSSLPLRPSLSASQSWSSSIFSISAYSASASLVSSPPSLAQPSFCERVLWIFTTSSADASPSQLDEWASML